MKILAVVALGTFGCLPGLAGAVDKPVPACETATQRAQYGAVIAVPAPVRELVENYRQSWTSFCNQQRAGERTLADLYAQAGRISAAFHQLIDQAIKAMPPASDAGAFGKRADALDAVLRTDFPKFVPAFEGSFHDSTFFEPSTEAFKAYASRGSVEDRLFFDSGMPLTAHIWDEPWLEPTWDYGGCLQFGRFDWAAEARKIARLKRELRSESYVQQLAAREKKFFSIVEHDGKRICTCDQKDAVLADYQNLYGAVEQEPVLATHVAGLRRMIAALQSSQIGIDSEKERHCSGG